MALLELQSPKEDTKRPHFAGVIVVVNDESTKETGIVTVKLFTPSFNAVGLWLAVP
jgi:hypothetical protein